MVFRDEKRNNNIIVGLDAGTTKICAIVAEVTGEGINLLSISSRPSAGLRKGVVIDIEAAASSLKETVEDAGEQAGKNIKEVYVGIAGSHIKGFSSFGTVSIKGREATREDVERAIDSASAVYVHLDREILHVFPTDFILDGQDGIKDPVGMVGVRLEVKVYIVTGAVASVQNLLKCCERAGLKVIDIVLQPLASAEATITNDERDMGIALIDIGGGTTDIAIYKEGWLRHTAVIGIGGNHFTNDISVGLKLPFHEAERAKKEYGSVLPSVLIEEMDNRNSRPEVDVVAIDGQVRGIPRKYIIEIMQPRGEELLEMIKKEIEISNNSGIAVLGSVLTGGSSLLADFSGMAEIALSMPVRIGYPHLSPQNFSGQDFSGRNFERNSAAVYDISGMKGEFNNPMYATGIGLVLYGAEHSIPDESIFFSSNVFSKIVEKMASWLKKAVGSRR